jgi:hypothetical protein
MCKLQLHTQWQWHQPGKLLLTWKPLARVLTGTFREEDTFPGTWDRGESEGASKAESRRGTVRPACQCGTGTMGTPARGRPYAARRFVEEREAVP